MSALMQLAKINITATALRLRSIRHKIKLEMQLRETDK
jgi:hypothetical protein